MAKTNLIRPLVARDPAEAHRAATPLELFFDLISVVAIAAAAAGLHHAIAEAHALEGVVTYLLGFFAIWWAWMNFTWFASAYDNDDALYRLVVMVIMGGSLTMAAGISSLVMSFDLTMVIAGYVIMRAGMILLWLRAAINDRERRPTTLAYAGGIFVAQIFWVIYLFLQPLPPASLYGLWIVGVIIELAVPVIAERRGKTPWHRHHIVERYGLLNIIVLGETILAGSLALRKIAFGATEVAFVHVGLSALVIVFSMWWLYFSTDDHLEDDRMHRAFIWGYGHYVVFASGAAVGAGFAVLVDIIDHHAKVSLLVGDYAVAIPVACYMLGLWIIRDLFVCRGRVDRFVLPVFVVLVLLAPVAGLGLEGVAAVTVLAVIVRSVLTSRARAAERG